MIIQSKSEITHFIVEIRQLYWSDLSVDWGIIHGISPIYSTVSNTRGVRRGGLGVQVNPPFKLMKFIAWLGMHV